MIIKNKTLLVILIVFLFFHIPLFANIISLIWYLFYIRQILPASTLQGMVVKSGISLSFVNFFLNIMPFMFAVLFNFFLYILPVGRGLLLGEKKPKLYKAALEKIIDSPLNISLIGISSWLVALILNFIILTLYYRFDSGSVFLMSNFIFFLKIFFTASLCFFISMLLMQLTNRHLIIPSVFEDKNIFSCVKNVKLSIMSKFYIYFYAIGLYPLAIVLTGIHYIKDHSDFYEKIDILNFVILTFLTVGILMTFVFSRLFQKPLIQMMKTTVKIKNGEYGAKIKIHSADEVGRLQNSINAMSQALLNKEKMEETFGKIVDPKVRDYLLQGNLNLGGASKNISILFVDIRDFTSISEDLPPYEVVQFLNRYFDKMSQCVKLHRGLVNKFIGDALMAIWGTPMKVRNHSEKAFLTALDIRKEIIKLNRSQQNDRLPPIRAAISVHSGNVLAGNIGSKNRMEYTVIGDTVNVASRMLGLCKELQLEIVLSEDIKNKINRKYDIKYIDDVSVKGRKKQVKIFSV